MPWTLALTGVGIELLLYWANLSFTALTSTLLLVKALAIGALLRLIGTNTLTERRIEYLGGIADGCRLQTLALTRVLVVYLTR